MIEYAKLEDKEEIYNLICILENKEINKEHFDCVFENSLKDEDIMVIEMGMNNFGEISFLTNIAKPTIAVITNVGTAHIGNLGSRENIMKAKLEIIEDLMDHLLSIMIMIYYMIILSI